MGRALLANILVMQDAECDPPAALGDDALMARYGKGDPAAFEALYRRHNAGLYRFIARLARHDADEIFQEVWMAVIRGRERYEPSARFATYLFAIAHKRIADRARKAAARPTDPLDGVEIPEVAPDPLGSTQNAQLGDALVAALSALPLAQREAFLMQSDGGLSLEEIAEVTGVSRETVKSRLRYANRHLRTALESWR